MLTKEFKEEALKKLEQMTAEDFIRAFEKIDSQRTEGTDNLCLIIEGDLERYGISNMTAQPNIPTISLKPVNINTLLEKQKGHEA